MAKKEGELIPGAVYVREQGSLGREYGVLSSVSIQNKKEKGFIHSMFTGLEAVYPDRMNGWSVHSVPLTKPTAQDSQEPVKDHPKEPVKAGKK